MTRLSVHAAWVIAAWSATLARAQDAVTVEPARVGEPVAHWEGLHGYISFGAEPPPGAGEYHAGFGFYTAVWALTEERLETFQIGLASAWIQPDNSDNRDVPLAPEGTLARTWPERGPTWDTVFQSIEGGVGMWAGNQYRYGLPKFSMNATPQCYDYEIGSPGWSFFQSREALADDRLGIAQLSNRLLVPPDGLPFAGRPAGELLGYSWMSLPLTDAVAGDPPTGEQSWTCFLHAANFRGPIAFYIPETWSKMGRLFSYPFISGRGLDARAAVMGGGAIEINTVPGFDAHDTNGVVYSKVPAMRFPVDARGRTVLVRDVTYYSKAALAEAVRAWRDGKGTCTGRFDARGAFRPELTAQPAGYEQRGKPVDGVGEVFNTQVFEDNSWGLVWARVEGADAGAFPEYFREVDGRRVVVGVRDVPAETGLVEQAFRTVGPGEPYVSPNRGAWATPGPVGEPGTARLADGSTVTYAWYRFVDQPSLQQYGWSAEKKANLQTLIENIHRSWTIDGEYMAPPSGGDLVALDPGLIVTPPDGLEVGYVPIVTGQRVSELKE